MTEEEKEFTLQDMGYVKKMSLESGIDLEVPYPNADGSVEITVFTPTQEFVIPFTDKERRKLIKDALWHLSDLEKDEEDFEKAMALFIEESTKAAREKGSRFKLARQKDE